MKTTLTAISALLLSSALGAQVPREMVQVGPPVGPALDPAISTHHELTALAFEQDFNQSIQIVTSDGRGLAWTFPFRVDEGMPSAKQLFEDSVFVYGDNIYVYWLDDRNAKTEVFFNSSFDRGQTFQPNDTLIPKGFDLDEVIDVKMAVDPRSETNAFDDLIVFLISSRNLSTGMEELYLNYSLDSGANFLVSPIPFSFHNKLADVDEIALEVENGLVYGMWLDNYNDVFGDLDDIWFSKYDVLAGTFMFQDVLINPASFDGYDADDKIALDVRGSTVAVAFQQDLPLGGAEELWVNVSLSGGLAFNGDLMVGDYMPGFDDVDHPDVAITPTGEVVVLWEDDRMGLSRDDIYTTSSFDGGLTFVPDMELSTQGGDLPVLVADETTVMAAWCSDTFPRFCEARWSKDATNTWNPCVTVSQNVGDTEPPIVAYNDFYTNFLVAWTADDLGMTNVYAGGFRRQTLHPVGDFYVPGAPIHFEVSDWVEENHGWSFGVLLSTSPGDYFLSNGRNMGLTIDAYALASIDMYTSGLLRGTIAADGSGMTPVLNAPPFLPFPIYAVAIAGQTPTMLGEVTDFVQLQ